MTWLLAGIAAGLWVVALVRLLGPPRSRAPEPPAEYVSGQWLAQYRRQRN
jgi:hypothetical protein